MINRPFVTILTILCLLAIVAIPCQAQQGNIYACYMKSTGAIRIVPTAGACKSNEVSISWNVQGPRGPAGPTGATGPAGPSGEGPAFMIVRVKALDEDTSLQSTLPPPVLHTMDLPAGSYFIQAIVDLVGDIDKPFYAGCILTADTDVNKADLWGYSTSFGGLGVQATTSLLHTFPAAGQVTIACGDSLSQPAFWTQIRMTAIQVQSISMTTIK